MIYKAPTSIKN